MKSGIAFFPTDTSIRPAPLGLALEERGFESIWVAEHSHIPLSRKSPWPGGDELPRMYYETYDPFVWLAAIAATTTTLRVATGICLVAQRDPIHTAKEVASLDSLSGGRFLFGVGAGWNEDEMNNHGTPMQGRFRLMRERVEAMKEIWANDAAEYHGELVDFEPIAMWPKPAQRPHPPIHVGGAFPGGARRAVRWCDGWIPIGGRGEGDIGDQVQEMRLMAEEAGRDPASIEVTIYYAPPDATAIQQLAAAGVDRVVFGLPSVPEPEAIDALDKMMAAVNAAGLREDT